MSVKPSGRQRRSVPPLLVTGLVALALPAVTWPAAVSAAPAPAAPAAAVAHGLHATADAHGRVRLTWAGAIAPAGTAAADLPTVCRVATGVPAPAGVTPACGYRGRVAAGATDWVDATAGAGSWEYRIVPAGGSTLAAGVTVAAPRASSPATGAATATPAVAAADAPAPAVLSGRVTAAGSGAPLPGVVVTVDGRRGEGDAPLAHVTATTGVDGTWTAAVDATQEGTGLLVCFDPGALVHAGRGASATGWVPQCAGGFAFRPGPSGIGRQYLPHAGETVGGIDAALRPGAAVSGTVHDSASTPVTGDVESVSAVDDAGIRRTASPDATGAFTVVGLVPGAQRVCAAPVSAPTPADPTGLMGACAGGGGWDGGEVPAAASITVVRAATTTAVGDVVLPAAAAVVGRIAGVDRSLAGAVALVRPARVQTDEDGYGDPAVEAADAAVATAPVAADGAFTVAGLAAGRYQVCVDTSAVTSGTGVVPGCLGAPWAGPGSAFPANATVVDLIAGTATTVAPQLAVGGALGGVVLSRSGPVSGAMVVVQVAGRTFVVASGADGSWRAAGLPAGSATVCAEAPAAPAPGVLPACAGGLPWDGPRPYDDGWTAAPAGAAGVPVVAGRTGRAPAVVLPLAGAVTGVVVAADGTPLAGYLVDVFAANDDVVRSGLTAADGRYAFSGLPAGIVRVCAAGTAAGQLVGGCVGGAPWSSAAYGPPDVGADPVVVRTATVTTAPADVLAGAAVIPPGGFSVSGRVTDQSGAPLAGAAVYLYQHVGHSPGPLHTVSRADGTWSDPAGLGDNTYDVCADGSGATGGVSTTGYTSVCLPDPVVVAPGAPVTGVDIELPVGAAVTGRVTDGAGGGIAGALVLVLDDTGYFERGGAVSAVDGSYRAAGLAAGRTQVCAEPYNSYPYSPPTGGSSSTGYGRACYHDVAWPTGGQPSTGGTPVDLTVGRTRAHVDVALPPGARLGGTVTAAGIAVAGASVLVQLHGGYVSAALRTGVDGSFAVDMPAGGYDVCVDPEGLPGPLLTGLLPGCAGGRPGSATSTTPVTVVAGEVVDDAGVDLAPAGAIAGRVTDAVSGAVVGGALVSAAHPGADEDYVDTGEDGAYRITGLPPGRYAVCVDGAGGDAATPGGLARGCAAAVVDVVGGAVATADVALRRAAGLSGRVTLASGTPVPGVAVTVFDAADPGGATVGGAETDANGGWVVGGLAGGDYVLCVDDGLDWAGPSPTGYAPQCGGVPWRDQYPPRAPAGAPTVHVARGGSVSGIGVVAVVAAAIAGRVTGPGGSVVQGTDLRVFDGLGREVARDYTGDGDYRIDGLNPGTYRVCVVAQYSTPRSVSQCAGGVSWDPTGPPPATAARVALPGGVTTRVDVVLPAG